MSRSPFPSSARTQQPTALRRSSSRSSPIRGRTRSRSLRQAWSCGNTFPRPLPLLAAAAGAIAFGGVGVLAAAVAADVDLGDRPSTPARRSSALSPTVSVRPSPAQWTRSRKLVLDCGQFAACEVVQEIVTRAEDALDPLDRGRCRASDTAAVLLVGGFQAVIGIVALIAALVLLYNKCEWFRNGVNA